MESVLKFAFFILFYVLFTLIVVFPVKWLWNDIAVSLFHFRTISAWEAWELLILCGLLFKSYNSK